MKNKVLILGLIMANSLFSFSQKVESNAYAIMLKGLLSHTVPERSATEAFAKKESAIFIDAREKKEYKVSHIKNSIWVGYDYLNLKPMKKLAKDTEIIVYCSVGYRSEKVAEKLKEKGFTNVSNLYGGIFEWKNNDFPIVNDNQDTTEKVHAYNKVWGIWLNKGEKVY